MKLTRFLIQNAETDEPVWLTVFTFDHRDLVNDIRAAQERGVQVTIISDLRQAYGHSLCKHQFESLLACQEAGASIYVMHGEVAESYGLDSPGEPMARTGIQHAKCLLCGTFAIVGSANYSTASLRNCDISVFFRLGPPGLASLIKRMKCMRMNAEEFDRRKRYPHTVRATQKARYKYDETQIIF